jgi:hypothetical protein
MINLETQYPGKVDTTDPVNYPTGKARNVTVSGDGTGTPWEKALVNDIVGFFQSVAAKAGFIPNLNPESVGNPQVLQGIVDVANIKNEMINPAFKIWQEGDVINVPAGAVTYTADQYFCFSAGADTTAAKSIDDLGQVCHSLTGVGSSTLVSFGQRFPADNVPRNTTELTFAFRVLMATAEELTWTIDEANAPDDFAAVTTITSGTFGVLSVGWQYLEVTIPVTSAQIANGYQAVLVLPNGIQATNVVKHSEMQLNKGSISPAFQANDYNVDLAACQPYGFEVFGALSGSASHGAEGYVSSGTSVRLNIKPPVPLRTGDVVLSLSGTLEVAGPSGSTLTTNPAVVGSLSGPLNIGINGTIVGGSFGEFVFLRKASPSSKIFITDRL